MVVDRHLPALLLKQRQFCTRESHQLRRPVRLLWLQSLRPEAQTLCQYRT